MTIFQKKTDGYQPQTKIQKRISKIATPDLILWAENSLFVIGKELTHWGRNHDKALLEEASLGAEALYEITLELKRRSSNDH
jgi:hypothetical protein